jgi:hypothetical protein
MEYKNNNNDNKLFMKIQFELYFFSIKYFNNHKICFFLYENDLSLKHIVLDKRYFNKKNDFRLNKYIFSYYLKWLTLKKKTIVL